MNMFEDNALDSSKPKATQKKGGGFKGRGRKQKASSLKTVLAFAFGVSFILGLVILALLVPNPTPFQYTVFRVILSLAAAGVAAVIPGFIELNMKAGARFVIHAGGAIAVFVIVYFVNPARIVGPPPGRAAIVPFIEQEDIHLGDNVYPARWGYSHNPLHMAVYPQKARGIVYYDKENDRFVAGGDKQTIISQMIVDCLRPLFSGIDFSGYKRVCAYQGQTPFPKELRQLMDSSQTERFVQIDPSTILYTSQTNKGDFYERYGAVGIVISVDFSMPLAKQEIEFRRESIRQIALLIECYHGGIRKGQSHNFMAVINGYIYPIETKSERAREKEVVHLKINPDHLQYLRENIVALVVLPWVEDRPKSYESNVGPAHFRDVGVVNAFFKVTQ